MTRRATLRSGAKDVGNKQLVLRGVRALECDSAQVSQVTCEAHVKWVTNEKSRKDRSMSKGVMMSYDRNVPRKEGHNRDVST